MTNKSNKRKFLATTLTATMVAAAVAPVAGVAAEAGPFPDVPADHNYAGVIAAMENAGVIKGEPNGNFNLGGKITRAEAAQMVAGLLDLKTGEEANATDFEDVKGNVWYTGAINSLVTEGIVAGKTATLFAPGADITRGELAQLLVEAYGLGDKNVDNVELPFTDVDEKAWFAKPIKILYSEGLIDGQTPTKFGPKDDMKRGDFAWLAANLDYAHGDKLPKPEAAVQTVKATNSTTITLTGTNLEKLKAEDITVEENTVKSINVNAAGTSVTIELESELRLNEDTKVTVQEKEYTVKYVLEVATAVAVTEATYDDDTARQYLAITVNGKKVTAQELINDGYNLEFVALDKKNASGTDISSTLFVAGGEATGELASDLDQTLHTAVGLANFPTAGIDVYVQVTLTKGTDVLTSELGKVTVKNKDLATDAISGFTLANLGSAFDTTTDDASIDTTPADGLSDAALFVQNSQTLVVGEYGYLNDIEVTTDGNKEVVQNNYSLKSANPAIVSVETDNGGNQVLRARTPGTANVTVSYGSVTKVIPVKVTNDAREATRVSVTSNGVTPISTLKTFVGQTTGNTVIVKAYDQNGDPIDSNLEVVNSNTTAVTVPGTGTPASFAVTTAGTPLAVTTLEKGSATITFKNSIGNQITSNSFIVQASENADKANYTLNVVTSSATRGAIAAAVAELSGTPTAADFSTDTTLDNLDDNFIAYTLDSYTSEGLKVATEDISTNVVTVNQSKIGVLEENGTNAGEFFEIVTVGSVEYLVVKSDNQVGNAAITIKDGNNKTIVNAQRINVTSIGYNVKSAALKTIATPTFGQTIDYTNVFNYIEADASKDPVIKGLTLTKASSQPTRLAITSQTVGTETADVGDLYLDRDADGTFSAGDIIIGSTALESTGTFATAIGADLVAGADVATGDEGTLIIKILDRNNKVVTSSSVTIDF